jgi:hypothetical protein
MREGAGDIARWFAELDNDRHPVHFPNGGIGASDRKRRREPECPDRVWNQAGARMP